VLGNSSSVSGTTCRSFLITLQVSLSIDAVITVQLVNLGKREEGRGEFLMIMVDG
jgi:hypothetical protein